MVMSRRLPIFTDGSRGALRTLLLAKSLNLIAFAMFVVVIAVAVFGPHTCGLTLEQISD